MTLLSKNARVAGLLYILASVVGVVRLLYIPTILIVHGNATATANNIVAHESLFRLGIVSQLLASVLWLFVPLALYRLLKEVDQALAVLMVILGSLMQVPIFFFNTVNDAAALLFARGGDFLTVFDSRSATHSPCCFSACTTKVIWPTRYFGGCGSSHSAYWCTGRAFCPASWAFG